MSDAERTALHDAIQAVIAEHEQGALVVGWFLTCEVRDQGGKPWLMHRTGDVNGEALNSWQGLGYLHSSVQSVEAQTWATTVDVEDDDDDDDDDAGPDAEP